MIQSNTTRTCLAHCYKKNTIFLILIILFSIIVGILIGVNLGILIKKEDENL
jgi:uncharacterized integral membrane protein